MFSSCFSLLFIYLSFYAAFPSLKTRRQGRRGQVRYHYMRLQFVNLSTRPPKSMWENNSDESDSDGASRKRKRAGSKKAAANKRGKVSAGGEPPIPATTTTKTSNVTTEETYEEEETAIVRCEFPPSQPTTPSEDEGDQSFYNSCDDLAALSQGSMLSFLQQPPLPLADVNEWMTTISDYPAYAPPPPSFPLYDDSLPFLDFSFNTFHNTNTYLNNVEGDNPPGLNLEEHLVRLRRQRQEEAMARTPFQPHKADTTWVTFPFTNLLRLLDPCEQGLMAPTSSQL